MRIFLSLCLFLPVAAFAQDDCPQLSGTFANCTTTIQDSNITVQQFVITQQGDQYTLVETDLSGKTTTEVYTADGSVITQTQNDPTYGQIVSTQQASCVNNSVMLLASSTVGGQAFFSMQESMSLSSDNQIVMALSVGQDANSLQSVGTLSCTRINSN